MHSFGVPVGPEKKCFPYYSNCRHFLCSSVYSHRRSGKVTARRTNRTTFSGQPSGWLFFCRSERSICIAPPADGNRTIMETHIRRTPYRPMNHNRHCSTHGRSYRTACREVNSNDQIIIRKEDYKHDRPSIQHHRCTAHIQRILAERRTCLRICT